MGDYSIRRMTVEDVPAVHRIETACFSTPWTYDMLFSEMSRNKVARYLVAEGEGGLLGFAGAHIVLDEGHITNIAVLREARRQGLGRALTQALLQYAANLGVSYMTLEVRRSNLAAQRMYEAVGFERLGVRKRYYEDNGEDALLMVCTRMPPAEPDFVEPETLLLED